MIANVIFPAFLSPHVGSIFFPPAILAALFVEALIYSRFRATPNGRVVVPMLLANLASWVVGAAIAFLLPSGLVPQAVNNGAATIVTSGPDFEMFMYLSFPVACVISVVVEYLVLRPMKKRMQIERIGPAVIVANIASYCVLFGVLLVFIHGIT